MVLARTINFYFNTYYAGLSGDALGSYTVKASEIYICATIGLTSILMLGNIEGDKKVKIDWFTRLIDVNLLERYKIWLAEWYVGKPSVSFRVDIWQYTNKEKVDGVYSPLYRL